MTRSDEQRIRDRIGEKLTWVNGDAYRAELRILIDEIESLRKLVNAQAERIAAQSEVLAKCAERL